MFFLVSCWTTALPAIKGCSHLISGCLWVYIWDPHSPSNVTPIHVSFKNQTGGPCAWVCYRTDFTSKQNSCHSSNLLIYFLLVVGILLFQGHLKSVLLPHLYCYYNITFLTLSLSHGGNLCFFMVWVVLILLCIGAYITDSICMVLPWYLYCMF